MNAKLADTAMYPNVKLLPNQGEPLSDPERYRRLVGKLNHLTIIRPYISFTVSVVSQFLNQPNKEHWVVIIHILKCMKEAQSKGFIYENHGHT